MCGLRYTYRLYLKRRQRNLSRKQKGSPPTGTRPGFKVARAPRQGWPNARRDFHHQLSTALIRDNQAVRRRGPGGQTAWPGTPAGQVRP